MRLFEITTPYTQDGNTFYTDEDGKFHNDDGKPAVIWKNGREEYWNHGKRMPGPIGSNKPVVVRKPFANGVGFDVTITYPDGTVVRGMEEPDGMMTFVDDKKRAHRDGDRPAVIAVDGSKFWYKHGELHRDAGPAVIFANGKEEYWENGKRIPDHEWPPR